MTTKGLTFNPPPGWPKPPEGWVPPKGWAPDPKWPPVPPGWQLWIGDVAQTAAESRPIPDPAAAALVTTVGPDGRIALLEAENAELRSRLKAAESNSAQIADLDDDRVLQDIGIYRYHHPLENAVAYRDRLDQLSIRIADMVKLSAAIEKSNLFTFDGSLAKGRSMTNDLAKLMLRAYNAEAENVVRTLWAGNVALASKRIGAARDAIAKLGSMMEMRISDAYHALRMEEIELTADYQMKKEEEREALAQSGSGCGKSGRWQWNWLRHASGSTRNVRTWPP